jgi:hypothetical protein
VLPGRKFFFPALLSISLDRGDCWWKVFSMKIFECKFYTFI